MTSIQLPDAAPSGRAGHIGQATVVEQSRAVAEVQAAVVVAQQCPRNVQAAIIAMRESCAQRGLADRAFFRYSRGDQVVTGPSIHLARDLARCWGNIQHSIGELRRDDEVGESEMLAFAWDVQTNTRAARTFIVKHARDTKKGRRQLVELRDITENNTNIAARQLREAIFNVLPPWFVEDAKDLCMATLRDGGGKPMATQVADAVKAFAGKGVTVEQLERKQGRKTGEWTEHDVAALRVVYTSIDRGEVTIVEEFEPPDAPVTKAEIDANAAADPVVSPPAEPTPEPGLSAEADATPQPISETTEQEGDDEATRAHMRRWQDGSESHAGEDDDPANERDIVDVPLPPVDEDQDEDDGRDVFAEPLTTKQSRAIHARLRELGVEDRDAKLAELSAILGRDLASTKDLTVADAITVQEELRRRVLRLGEPHEPSGEDGAS